MPPLPTGFEGWGLFGVFAFILLSVVWALITGRLVPKSTMEARIRDKENELANTEKLADLWEATALKKDQALDTLMPAVKEILEVSKTQLKLIEALGTKPAGDPQ